MEIWRALGALVDPPGPETDRLAGLLEIAPPRREDHAAFFGFRMYPYASVYLSASGRMGGEARYRIAGFWSALGLTPPAEPDHLGTMLALHAELSDRAAQAVDQRASRILSHARKAYLFEHLGSWLPLYCLAASRVAPPGYRGWVSLLRNTLESELAAEPEPDQLPLALREAPPASTPAGVDHLIDFLLSPVQSGMVVTRDDLVPLAETLGTGLRQGERRFLLRELYRVAPAGFLEFWAGRLDGWAGDLPGAFATVPAVGRWWSGRAAAAAGTIRELASDVGV